MIAFSVGLCDLLEDYADLLLLGLDILKFPTTVALRYEKLQARLSKLSKKFDWRDEDLRMTEIGNPKEIIKNLKKGKYKCEISKGVRNAAALRLNISIKENNRFNAELSKLNNEILENQQHELVLPEDINEAEFSVISNANLVNIKKRLRKISSKIFTSLAVRIQIPDIIRMSIKAFNFSQSDEAINKLIDCLDGNKAEMFQE